MNCVIDANIVKAYFEESVHGIDYGLTARTIALFEESHLTTVFFDSTGRIEHEWEQNVDPEWFRAWLISLMDDEIIQEIEHVKEKSLEKRLIGLGWNRGKKDFIYVWTALAVRHKFEQQIPLITEDMDFYNPKLKKILKGTKRTNFIRRCSGPIVKCCRKFSIHILCVEEAAVS